MFDDATLWNDCKSELKMFCREYRAQAKSHCRCKNINGNDDPSPDRTETDESELDSSTRLAFNVVVSGDSLVNNERASEAKKEATAVSLQARSAKESFQIGLSANPNGNDHAAKRT